MAAWPHGCTIPCRQQCWKGAHREYFRDGWQQELLDLDGIVDRRVDGTAARTGWKLKFADHHRFLINSCGLSFPRKDLEAAWVPIGRKTLKQVPAPPLARRDRKRKVPRCFITRLFASHNPNPVPLSSLVVKNGSSTRL